MVPSWHDCTCPRFEVGRNTQGGPWQIQASYVGCLSWTLSLVMPILQSCRMECFQIGMFLIDYRGPLAV